MALAQKQANGPVEQNRVQKQDHLTYNKDDTTEQSGKDGLLNKWHWVNSV